MTLGRKLRQLRLQAGLTPQQLAKEARITQSYVSRLERDISKRPSADVLFRLARALHTDPDYLFIAAGYTDEEIVRAQVESPLTNLAAQADRELTDADKQKIMAFIMFLIQDKRKREREHLDSEPADKQASQYV